jgi:cytochrome c peroxidase
VAAIRSGEQLFKRVGCAVCHRPSIGNVKGIYSDLLVHVMGSKLADPSMAPLSPPAVVTTPSPTRYYGGGSVVNLQTPPTVDKLARHQEWKTPPLWGLRDSGPYLHDGRAKTVEEAIAYHGGEAAGCIERYLALPGDARARLLTFLSTLAAPDPSSLPKPRGTKDQPPATVEHRRPRLLLPATTSL